MDEYIEREAVYEKAYWHGEHPDVGNSFPDGVDAIDIKDVDAIPAADVAPVRHGRWIKESDGGTRCSVCNKRVRDVTGGGDEPVDLSDMPYCPKCGAKMDLEDTE